MQHKPASKAAARVYKALKLSNFTIIPEYKLPGRLRIDYVVRELNAGLEIDGNQHYEYSAFMHGDKDGFRNSQKRDNQKEVLCEQEGLTLVRLTEDQINNAANPEELLKLILDQLKPNESEEEW